MCVPINLRHRVGFTLLELTVAMTLLVLLALVAVPLFVGATRGAQIRTAAQQTVALLRYARAKALSLGRPVLVSVDRSNNRLRVLVPAEVVQSQRNAVLDTMPSSGTHQVPDVELTDEDWRAIAGEQLEPLDPDAFVPDPSPMGQERQLPDGVTVAALEDLTTGEEVNLIAFYPDGSASGVRLVLQGQTESVTLEVTPLTGTVQVVTALPADAARR